MKLTTAGRRGATSRAATQVLAAACLVLTVAGCAASPAASPATSRTSSPADGQPTVVTPEGVRPAADLVWALDSEPTSLDWVYSYDYPSNTVLANVCESLLRIDASFMTSPGLAERVDNPDQLTWVYRLRPGVRFHDGSPLTAADVAFSLDRHRDATVGSYWAGFYGNVAAITVTGPLEVTVRLSRPDALFPQMLAVAGGVISKQAAVLAQGSRYGTAAGGLVCTGPFSLHTWTPGRSIELRRFAGYWDREHAAVSPSMRFEFAGTTEQQRAGLRSGRFDGMFNPQLSERDTRGQSATGPQTSTRNLVVADLTGPLRDVRIRRALSMALDRTGFIRRAGLGGAQPSRAVAAPLTWGQGEARSVYQRAFDALPAPRTDVPGARALVAEAGAPAEQIVLAVTDNAVHAALAKEVVAAAASIGLRVQVRQVPPDEYGTLFVDADARAGIDLFHTQWYADIADPLVVHVNWQSGNSANYAGWIDPAYDRLVAAALAQDDPVERARLVVQLQARVVDQLLWIPVEQSPSSVWQRSGLTGAPTTNAYLYYPWAAALGER